MAAARKYLDLADVDSAPDTYETPELTDDNLTRRTSTTPDSDYNKDEDEAKGIDRHRLDPDEARTHFLPSHEKDPYYSGRISSKRKSYRSSSRKRRKDGAERNGLINGIEVSDEDEGENLERKLARLRREVAEVKEAFERSSAPKESATRGRKDENATLDSLSQVLESVALDSRSASDSAIDKLTKRLAISSRPEESSDKHREPDSSEQNRERLSRDGINAPNHSESHDISRISDFESRLALIEAALGTDAIPLPTQDSAAPRAVLPSLEMLDKQFSTIATSTDSSLDTVSRRVRQLIQDTESLEHARKAAKAAQEALRQESLSPRSGMVEGTAKPSDLEDPESMSKINALYGTLPTIESLAPVLPSVLDRLRSLRSVHADAATANQTLTQVESRQAEMKSELQDWRQGLEKVEKAMEQGEQTTKGNTEMIDGWVKDLKNRMQSFHK